MSIIKKWFRWKKKEPEYVFSRTIPYKGYKIFVYCQKDDIKYYQSVEDFCEATFKTGWNVGGYGVYNTGIAAKRLSDNILDHVKVAQRYVDKLLEAPGQVKEAQQVLSKLEL